jgi:3-hydroxybutyrate dehydrogenase
VNPSALMVSKPRLTSSGICLSFVKHLYQAGCNVLICDIALHREATAWLDSIQGGVTNGSASARVVFSKTDVTDWKQLDNAFVVYTEEFGGVPYVLCPGAGVYEPVRSSLSSPAY